MTVYALFVLFCLTVVGYGFVESWREDRQRARRRHPSTRVRGGGLS